MVLLKCFTKTSIWIYLTKGVNQTHLRWIDHKPMGGSQIPAWMDERYAHMQQFIHHQPSLHGPSRGSGWGLITRDTSFVSHSLGIEELAIGKSWMICSQLRRRLLLLPGCTYDKTRIENRDKFVPKLSLQHTHPPWKLNCRSAMGASKPNLHVAIAVESVCPNNF